MILLLFCILRIHCSENPFLEIGNYLINSGIYDEACDHLKVDFDKDLSIREKTNIYNDNVPISTLCDNSSFIGSSISYSSLLNLQSEPNFNGSIQNNETLFLIDNISSKNSEYKSSLSYNLIEKLDFYINYLSEIGFDWVISNSRPYTPNNSALLEIDIDIHKVNWKESLSRFRSEFDKYRYTLWVKSVFPELIMYEAFIENLLKNIDCFKFLELNPSYSTMVYLEYNNRVIELIQKVLINISYKDLNSALYKKVKSYPTIAMSILSLDLFISQLHTYGEIMILHLESINAYINQEYNKNRN